VLADHPDATTELDPIVPTGGSSPYAWIDDGEYEPIVRDPSSIAGVDGAVVLDELPGRTLVRFEWPTTDSPLFDQETAFVDDRYDVSPKQRGTLEEAAGPDPDGRS
jgi:hypothetical protein